MNSIDSRCSYSVSQAWAFMFVNNNKNNIRLLNCWHTAQLTVRYIAIVRTSNFHGQNYTRRAIFRLGIDTLIANILVFLYFVALTICCAACWNVAVQVISVCPTLWGPAHTRTYLPPHTPPRMTVITAEDSPPLPLPRQLDAFAYTDRWWTSVLCRARASIADWLTPVSYTHLTLPTIYSV